MLIFGIGHIYRGYWQLQSVIDSIILCFVCQLNWCGKNVQFGGL